jgi:hypothetical protein
MKRILVVLALITAVVFVPGRAHAVLNTPQTPPALTSGQEQMAFPPAGQTAKQASVSINQSAIDAQNAATPTDKAAVMKVVDESKTNLTQARKDAKLLTPTQHSILTTPTGGKTTVKIKAMPAQPATAAEVTNDSLPTPDGSGYLHGAACYGIWVHNDQYINFFGITTLDIASVQISMDYPCVVVNLYGYWVIYNQPSGSFDWQRSNPLFWLTCGLSSWTADWLPGEDALAFQVVGIANWAAMPYAFGHGCFPPIEESQDVGLWLYAGMFFTQGLPLVVWNDNNFYPTCC